jgi:hypothetical protein
MEQQAEPIAADSSAPDAPGAKLLTWVDRRRWWLFGGILVLHILAYNGQWRISPDSALYAELGRNLAEGQGFTYHGEPHTWVEPGLPYVIGFSFRHFGKDNFHPLMLAMLGCSLAALALNYVLFSLYAGRAVAVLITSLLGLSETFFRYGYHLFTDMPFLAAVMAFLVGYELIFRQPRTIRGWTLAVTSTLFMVAFRPAVITFAGAVGLTCAWHILRGPGRVRHLILGLVVLVSIFAFRKLDPRHAGAAAAGETQRESMLKSLLSDKLGYAVKRMVTDRVPMLLEETTTEAIFGTRLLPGMSSVVAIAIIGAGVLLVRKRLLWGAWVAATVAQMAFWLPRERYFLPILPLLLFGIWDAGNWLAARLPDRWRRATPVAIVILLVAPNLGYIGWFIIEQRRTPFLAYHDKGKTLKMITFAKDLGAAISPDATVIADDGRELSYFSRRRVIDPLTERRMPLTPDDYEQFRRKLEDDRSVYAVLPGRNTRAMIEKIGGQLGDAVLSEGDRTVYRIRFPTPPATTQP